MAGYIGTTPTPQSTQTRETFTATAGQTSFATVGYTPNFVDVYLNGVHLLNGTDYTATNGSDIVLTSGAAAGDVLEVISYSTYEVNSQNYTGGLTVNNDGATVLTVDRATSDGLIIDVQKDGTTVGSIGTQGGDLVIGTGDTGVKTIDLLDAIVPYNTTTNSSRDAAIDLGYPTNRFKNLYLSGGVYLGGTGAANYLDDYEEGTWTPSFGGDTSNPTVSYLVRNGDYTKVGRIVHVRVHLEISGSASGGSGGLYIDGLPFTSANDGYVAGTVSYVSGWDTGAAPTMCLVNPNTTKIPLYLPTSADPRNTSTRSQVSHLGTGTQIYLAVSYNV